jgi:hypothetical protein
MLYLDCSCLNLAPGIFLDFWEFLEYFSCLESNFWNFLNCVSTGKYLKKHNLSYWAEPGGPTHPAQPLRPGHRPARDPSQHGSQRSWPPRQDAAAAGFLGVRDKGTSRPFKAAPRRPKLSHALAAPRAYPCLAPRVEAVRRQELQVRRRVSCSSPIRRLR